jgi:magnesium transporter
MNNILTIAFDHSNQSIEERVPAEKWVSMLHNNQFTLWVDLLGDDLEEFEKILKENFHFHPLAIKDALIDSHVPRIDDWKSYVYLTLRCTLINEEMSPEIRILELDIFIGDNYLVTYHKEALEEVDTLFATCKREPRVMEKGAANLFYQLADKMVNNYLPVIEFLDEKIDQIEDEIFDHPKTDILSDIFSLKRTLLHLRGTFNPQREVFNKMARGDFEAIPVEQHIYYRDIYDHMVRLEELNESLRGLISGALDTHLSMVNNRMNDVMKTLTIITTLFMPLAFITGFFGMNFFQPTFALDSWTGIVAFLLVLASTILTPLVMSVWMRRKGWM